MSSGMRGALATRLMSSRLRTQPPRAWATRNSDSLVLFEVNMMFSGGTPAFRASISSGVELQSRPKPMLFMMARMAGLGRALTAKNSWNPSAPAKAALKAAPVSRMPVSS